MVGEYMRHGGGWGIGFKVAKWCKNEGRGRPRKSSNDDLKVSCAEFALMAGVSDMRIARYLKGWNAAAKDGIVPHSSEILPDTEWTPDEDVFISPAMGRGARSRPVPMPVFGMVTAPP